jgi:predicted nucleotidyltransferase
MAKSKVEKAVNHLREFLIDRNIRIHKVIVFGSYAKGGYRKYSDIDIAIVSRDFEGKDIFEKAEMLKGLKWFMVKKILLPLDIVPLSLSEWKGSSMIAQFAKEGFEVNLS